jgi:hypothetical protein
VSTGAQYVAAAYGVILFVLLMYVVVIGLRSARIAREAELLGALAERDAAEEPVREDDPVEAAPPGPSR